MINNLNSVVDNFSNIVDVVNLLALSIDEIEERLDDKDVIFVVGGDTDYLIKYSKRLVLISYYQNY